jgi:spore coat protein SA
MKIAFISQGLGRINPPHASGSISIWTYEVLCELKKTEEIIAYEMDGGNLRSSVKEFEGVQYIYAPTLLNRLINRFHQKILDLKKISRYLEISFRSPFFASICHNLGYILWVALHVRKQRCDVIHVHQFSQYVPILRFFNRESRIVLHMNCEWLTQLDEELIRRRIAKADLILGSSDYISEKIQKRFPDFRDKIKTVYNGVHHNRFAAAGKAAKSTKNHPQLLFVGRVSPEKGIHNLIGAIRILLKTYPSIHLNVVGSIGSAPKKFIVDLSDDSMVKELSKFYSESAVGEDYYYTCLKQMMGDELKPHITFTGSMPQEKLVKYYRDADILVNPSLSESFGMSLAEAMASERPVVATRVGGMVNVVDDGVTGLLVDGGREDQLAEAIRHLIEAPDLMSRMGKAGRQRILNKFSWERVSQSLLERYREHFGRIHLGCTLGAGRRNPAAQ